MVLTPPQNISKRDFDKPTVFLAGSIEMGKAEDWQTDMSQFFFEFGFTVFNPRRKDWDSTWLPEFTNPNFYQQVNWELNALDNADIIIMYFSPGTYSPISLLELGLYATSGKLRVVCPDGFWRKGNVEFVCNKYDIPMFNNLDELIKNL